MSSSGGGITPPSSGSSQQDVVMQDPPTNTPPASGGGGGGGDESDDEDDESSVWLVKEDIQQKTQKSTKPTTKKQRTDPSSGTTADPTATVPKDETFIYWTIEPSAIIRPRNDAKRPTYVPWVEPGSWTPPPPPPPPAAGSDTDPEKGKKRGGDDEGKTVYFVLSTTWDRWRQRGAPSALRDWPSRRAGAKIIEVLEENGSVKKIDLKDSPGIPKSATNTNAGWVDFFDKQFAIGQARAKVIKDAIDNNGTRYSKWKPVDVPWEERTSGDTGAFVDSTNDKRSFTPRTDGIGFEVKAPGSSEPERVEWYIKLRKSAAGATVMRLDEGAKDRGLSSGGIFIDKSTMKLLRDDKFIWKDNENAILVRTETGEVSYILCNHPDLRKAGLWQTAYDHGTSQEQSFGSRSRNVAGLNLLFVVSKDSVRINVADFQEVVDRAKKEAGIPIKSTAEVVGEDDYKDSLKTKYSRFLSTSPFGDYETYVNEADFISFLKAYPGYVLPDVSKADALTKAMASLKPGDANKAKTEDWDKRRIAQTAKIDVSGMATGPDTTVNSVSYNTIVDASKAGRKNFPQQKAQMGDSATAIAKVCDWPTGQRIASAKDDTRKLQWDAPGVQSSEWLHRTAYSWGNEFSPGVNQSSSNFVFGSSEANSIMTRYEKAWQSLFYKDSGYGTKLDAEGFKDPKRKPLSGVLVTVNTDDKIPVVEYSVDADKLEEKTIKKDTSTITSSDTTFQPADYWQMVGKQRNLSFSLRYNLYLKEPSKIGISQLREQVFFPFQRGFFTRFEADVDAGLLKKWTNDAISLVTAKKNANDANNGTLPTVTNVNDAANGVKGISLTETGGQVVSQSSDPVVVTGSPLIVSNQAPSDTPQAEVWKAAVNGNPVDVGGITLDNASVVTLNDDGHMLQIPLGSTAGDPDNPVQVEALVAKAPLETSPGAVKAGSDQAATEKTTITVPPELAKPEDTSNIPNGFVLSGTVKLFGKFDEQLYVFYGSAATGMRQIVQVKAGSVKLSDYISSLEGSKFDALQLQNTQLIYNELTTVTDAAGTWIQTDVVFSGPLQGVRDFLKNVCHQDKPALRMQAFLTPKNDWTKPLPVGELGLRASLPGLAVKIGDMVTITELGVGVGLSRTRQPWPPYEKAWSGSASFFGTLHLETPNDMAAMNASFAISYIAGIVNLSLDVDEDETSGLGFCGIEGLKLSSLTMSTSFAADKSPSLLGFNASADLAFRDTRLRLDGFYAKADWGFRTEVDDFDFDDLRDMYEDLFGAKLHLSAHEVELDELVFMAGSSGMSIEGSVTIEGHTSAKARIAINRMGVSISGEVDDVPLEGDIVLKRAALDVFIGRQDDTTLKGPGTSLRFAITGTVAFGKNEVSASLFLDKDASGNLFWTVIGAYTGAFSLAKLAPGLKDTFLDLSLQQVALIASNVDGNAAAGALVPAGYPIIKGVQVAATLNSVAALDSAMGKKGAPTSGMTLRAIYDADTSAFELAIQLAAPQNMSMKSGNVYSGPISLMVMLSPSPSLVVAADFFVKVANQTDPLKFTGGMTLNVDEAKLFIEMKNQWWSNPFGLSQQLRLGPDLALQIGIVYPSPIYPSEIGIAAGLAIGGVSGKAALSISDAPNDELIMLQIDNLGVRDLVAFANQMFEQNFPMPDDFLRFKQLKFYLSTGTTIGTIVYPPGASFSCDAVIFGYDASIYCGVNKATKEVQVKGSLQAIDVGPLSVSGYTPGTPAQLDVTLGSSVQKIFIDGGIRLLDIDARIKVNAVLQPTTTFDLQTELDFSSHLTFLLEAHLRGGGFSSAASMKALDFDVHAVFHQDILDYVAAQVNTQVLAAKHAVDDGVDKAQKTLDQAQKDFQARVDTAQAQVNAAKSAYDAKVSRVNGQLAAEQQTVKIRTQQLQAGVDNAIQTLNNALASASQKLQTAKENRERAIRDAQQKVNDAKANGDRDIDNHLRDLNNAKDDMQRRFGDAVKKVQDAQNDVNSKQSAVDSAQRDYDDAKRDLDHSKWYEKTWKGPKVGALGAKLEGIKAGLEIAKGTLNAAKAIIQGPGYAAASASINAYGKGVEDAKVAADRTLQLANAGLQQTINAQNSIVNDCQNALTLVQTSGVEQVASNAAKKALADFQAAEVGILKGLQQAVDTLAQSAEAVAFGAATAGLNVARANIKDLDVARSAVKLAGEGADGVLDAGNWLVAHAVNVLNIKNVDIKGDLRGMALKGAQLSADVQGTFAEQPIHFSVDFLPGKGEEFAKRLFEKLMGDAKAGLLKIGPRTGGK